MRTGVDRRLRHESTLPCRSRPPPAAMKENVDRRIRPAGEIGQMHVELLDRPFSVRPDLWLGEAR